MLRSTCTRLGRERLATCLRQTSTLSLLASRNPPIDVHPEVQDALASNKPVVALETTLVTHGFPYPTNLELGIALEKIVRDNGSVPATIGIIGGRVKVGLERSQLERLADRQLNPHIVKVSRRDIAPALAQGLDGGTTCSATLIFSAMAGIKVFATGGLGGVHRGGENSMDVSADLHELTRCPVGLVSSGVKSILDIGRTLEYLETLGVPVISYSDSREFPAFFAPRSGYQVPWNFNDPRSAARMLYTQWQLGFDNGALIGVPIPSEYEASGAQIQAYVEQAIAESEANGVSRQGKEATPWLLNRIAELSKGISMESNIALLKNTALVGSQIAVEYQKLTNHGKMPSDTAPSIITTSSSVPLSEDIAPAGLSYPPVKLLVAGCAAVDLTAVSTEPAESYGKHSTTPGQVSFSLGGVARNIAEASHRVATSKAWNFSTLLVAPIGNDAFGRTLRDGMERLGMRADGLVQTEKRTAVCNMLLDYKGDLIGGIADMNIAKDFRGEEILHHIQQHNPQIVALDGNLSSAALQTVAEHCTRNKISTFFEPTSVAKATSILPAIEKALSHSGQESVPITFATPNQLELAQLYRVASSEEVGLTSCDAWWTAIDGFALNDAFRMELRNIARQTTPKSTTNLEFLVDHGTIQMAINLLPFFQHLIVKCGAQGVLVVMRSRSPKWFQRKTNIRNHLVVNHGTNGESVIVQHFNAQLLDNIVNVTGAGDSLVGALLAQLANDHAICGSPEGLAEFIELAQQAAALTLQSPLAVSPALSHL
ncbi:indigoidine synthase A-like protein [Pluteus cervinus]|uniref:Indigoidine synthase A-like protein n=1 Tax=Pluteus cervinus TaxID=181527 RepID=A0ACD3BHU2_9AGAR|nr:indigoidine synthase A-like protein [Pluteus cervinus]